MSILLSVEIALSAASGAIHAAEILIMGISGLLHAMFKNILITVYFVALFF